MNTLFKENIIINNLERLIQHLQVILLSKNKDLPVNH